MYVITAIFFNGRSRYTINRNYIETMSPNTKEASKYHQQFLDCFCVFRFDFCSFSSKEKSVYCNGNLVRGV